METNAHCSRGCEWRTFRRDSEDRVPRLIGWHLSSSPLLHLTLIRASHRTVLRRTHTGARIFMEIRFIRLCSLFKAGETDTSGRNEVDSHDQWDHVCFFFMIIQNFKDFLLPGEWNFTRKLSILEKLK